MRKYLKRSTKQYIIVSALCTAIIGSAFGIAYIAILTHTKAKYQAEIHLLEEQLKSREVYVYEAKSVIPAGSTVTKDNLKYVKSYSNQSQDYFMTEKDIGKITLMQIEPGTLILEGMLTKQFFDKNLREVEYNTFLINSNIIENDFVDIRILYPNGEDYIVLSKKNIKHLNLEKNNCFLWLAEEEIIRMSSAIVDAYLYQGSKLYTTKYIEPSLQNPSIPTYQPSLATLKLMKENENIVERASQVLSSRLRKELESRMAEHTNVSALEPKWLAEEQIDDGENDDYYIDFNDEDNLKDSEVIVEYGG